MRLDLYKNVDTKEILSAIGIKEEDIPRLRGVGIDDGKILIHTRTGGGNREYYEDGNNYLSSNEFFLFDEDDSFDCTYANFWFRIPDEFKEKLEAMEDKEKKAILGDVPTAIGLIFGEKEAVEKAKNNLKKL